MGARPADPRLCKVGLVALGLSVDGPTHGSGLLAAQRGHLAAVLRSYDREPERVNRSLS